MTTARRLLRGDIARYGLTPAQSLVLLALLDRADRRGIAWPSQVRMAAELGMHRNGVRLALARLLELGLIAEAEPGRPGRSTRYRITGTCTPSVQVDDDKPAHSAGQVDDDEPAHSVAQKYLHMTGDGLPDSARSAAARRSVSLALRAAETDEETERAKVVARRTKCDVVPPGGGRRGATPADHETRPDTATSATTVRARGIAASSTTIVIAEGEGR